MRVTEVEFPNATPIDSYGPGFFRIGGEIRQGHLVLLPEMVMPWEGFGDWQAVIAAKADFDVLFIGTGADIAPIPAADRAVLDQAGIAYEPMATGAACRTYNVLLSEGRRVAAVVLTV